MISRFGARFRRQSLGVSRSPSTALRFYSVRHRLVHRLEPYRVGQVPSLFRRFTWNDLRYWALLLDEDDAGITRMLNVDQEIPTPEEWFGRVEA